MTKLNSLSNKINFATGLRNVNLYGIKKLNLPSG
jgi:hypothetical protein